ncbi:DNA photolyase family protein [Halobacillus yeomjeoni]|uniref:cryptochrome/photolyase family protein n=1 Tax=Halobacillus yeomjeoni TaxID=311194 RepID=UPI001CD6B30B|nr:deoxyribodipyrimidine photo-lyase [Halobacillus yeomjeoni]MCA0985403.1 DNA photolyase family protein [Halobacillus yeomjeoni]
MITRAIWFRRDLRLNDNTALAKALENTSGDDKVFLFFHIDPNLNQTFDAQHDYFFQTLKALVDDSGHKGAEFHFIEGEPEQAFDELLDTVDIDEVYFNSDEAGYGRDRDQRITKKLEGHDVLVYSFIDHHLHGAEEVEKKSGGYYKVFTPYYKQWKKVQKPAVQKVDHEKLAEHTIDETDAFSHGKQAFESLLKKSDRSFEDIGESAAREQVDHFLDDAVYDYDEQRDFPAVEGTSRMSKFLRTGAISIRTVYHAVNDQVDYRKNTEGVETFISELVWRDFYNMIHHFYPNAWDEEMVEKYRGLPWNDDEELFERWKDGKTGYPIVDAAMRQLNETGWMHNRLRMTVASFLTKDMLMDWRKGERYFAEKLVDYEPSSNIGGWQWAASTGTDPVPYFRVFNPTRQSERFDPHGRFIKEWIPELEHVSKNYIHSPSKMPDNEQEKSKCIIGEDYPEPIVDHKTMRVRAIEMFEDKK